MQFDVRQLTKLGNHRKPSKDEEHSLQPVSYWTSWWGEASFHADVHHLNPKLPTSR